MESIEASGKSVDEAVQQALSRLGKSREDVEITVLQEPSRGAFGIGGREARVRAAVRLGSNISSGAVITPEMADAILGPDDLDVPLPDQASETYEADDVASYEDDDEFLDEDEDEESEVDEGEVEDEDEEFVPFITTADQPIPVPAASTIEPTQTHDEYLFVENPTREDVEITVDVLQHLLRYMNIRATVQVHSTSPLTLNIHGINESLAVLIGRRGETLASLQLLVNLVVSHRTKRRMRIVVDAENYRQRREENLRSLALRVAQQVRNYRRAVALEAMPPNERRIVHIALSDSTDISTESIGEGDERRVVISLKRPGR
ncbi:MAG TPA: RNA-binding cell elongation regulator Jag/EloR [Ktedonobacteraceae bacterium]|nr:RNA-binding cell elongation regulator Jag/EloR [Ktedonobacteraceae bacterium]